MSNLSVRSRDESRGTLWISVTCHCSDRPVLASSHPCTFTFQPSLFSFCQASLFFRLILFLTLVAAGVANFPAQTYAAFEDGFIGARAFAMGGAFTAIAEESDGLLVNPASIANLRHQPESRRSVQQVSATMAKLHVGLTDETSITQNLISYAYSRPTQGALGLLWKRLSAGELYSENYLLVGASKSFDFGAKAKRRISLGGAVKVLDWDTAPTIGVDGAVVEDLPGRSRLAFDVGMIFRPSPNIPIALALQNLNTPNIASASSRATENLPLQVMLGMGIVAKKVTWGMDLVFRESEVDVKVGIESQFYEESLVLRGGFPIGKSGMGNKLDAWWWVSSVQKPPN